MIMVMSGCFEGFDLPSDQELREDLSYSVGPQARSLCYVAYNTHNGDPLSAGIMNIFPKLSLGFLMAGSTIPSARGRGVYSALVTARMVEAQQMGISHIGLYAMRETSAPIVKKQGFQKHGPIHFLERPIGKS